MSLGSMRDMTEARNVVSAMVTLILDSVDKGNGFGEAVHLLPTGSEELTDVAWAATVFLSATVIQMARQTGTDAQDYWQRLAERLACATP